MILTFEAQNISGQISDFVLLGVEPAGPAPAVEEHEGNNGARHIAVPILTDALVERWHVAITIRLNSVEPGQHIGQEIEMDYDPRQLRWITPDELRGRFFLSHLRWGDHELMKRPGAL